MDAVQANETIFDPNEVDVRITRFTVTLCKIILYLAFILSVK